MLHSINVKEMSDPLSLLRLAIINKVPIDHADGWYTFGNSKFPETLKTSFRRSLIKEGGLGHVFIL